MVGRFERNKDMTQEFVASTAEHVGEIVKIITGAVAGVTRQVGEIVSDGIEMREAAKLAAADEARAAEPVETTRVAEPVETRRAELEIVDAELEPRPAADEPRP